MKQNDYPLTVAEVIEDVEYPREILHALRRFAKSKPWRGCYECRVLKLRLLHEELNQETGLKTDLIVGGSVNSGIYIQDTDLIILDCSLSILTYLHEYSHSLNGPSEREACRWSINLFRRVFPISFSRLQADRHLLTRVPR